MGGAAQGTARAATGPAAAEGEDDIWGKLRDDWVSFVVICCVVLLGDSARGIMFPTLWPFVRSLGGNRLSHGYTVAAFSLGRALASPFIGKQSSRRGYQTTLVVCNAIIMVGGFVYGMASSMHVLLAAQILIGVGSGSLGVTRAYVAELCPPSSRTVILAYLTAVQYGGFTCTPFIGALLTRIFGSGVSISGAFTVNKFSAPGFFTCIWAMASVLCLAFVFREPQHSRERMERRRRGEPEPERPPAKPRRTYDAIESGRGAGAGGGEPRVVIGGGGGPESQCFESDETVLGALLALNVATKGSIACFETLGAMFAFAVFSMSIPFAGQLFASCGAAGVISLLCMRPLCRAFNEVQLIVGGLVAMVVSCATISLLQPGSFVYFFYAAVALMYAVGYPIGHTAVIGVFSKVAEGRSQGTLLSWFGTAGSLARIFFPMLSGFVAETFGFSALFGAIALLLLGTIVAVYRGRHCLLYHMAH